MKTTRPIPSGRQQKLAQDLSRLARNPDRLTPGIDGLVLRDRAFAAAQV